MKARYSYFLVALTMVSALIGGAIGAQTIAVADGQRQTALPQNATTFENGPASFSPLVKAVKPAVVNISISGHVQTRQFEGPPGFPEGSPFEEFFRDYFGGRGPDGSPGPFGGPRVWSSPSPEFKAVGSGFIISADGLVVTNNHVIDHADEIEVVLQDGTRYSATIQGRDAKTDLALLKLDTDDELPYVELGSSENAEVGDWVVAVGNPFGLGGTVTAGIISARGRDIQAGPFDDFLQIDAPINRGNSGGPLFDSNGRVIGINTAIFSPSGGSIGIGFAIPSELAGDVIDQLKTNGLVERGWLGIEFQQMSEAVAASLGLDGTKGALVAGVVENGPADKAGVKVGDVILSLDGKSLDQPKDLPRLVANTKAGTDVKLQVLRDGKKRNLDVEIGRSEAEAELAATPAAAPGKQARLGVELAELTPDVRQRFGISTADGVLVTNVLPGSPASKAGIRPGQVITMVGQKPVDSPKDVVKAVEKAADEGRPSVLLMVEQAGAKRFVAVDLVA